MNIFEWIDINLECSLVNGYVFPEDREKFLDEHFSKGSKATIVRDVQESIYAVVRLMVEPDGDILIRDARFVMRGCDGLDRSSATLEGCRELVDDDRDEFYSKFLG